MEDIYKAEVEKPHRYKHIDLYNRFTFKHKYGEKIEREREVRKCILIQDTKGSDDVGGDRLVYDHFRSRRSVCACMCVS